MLLHETVVAACQQLASSLSSCLSSWYDRPLRIHSLSISAKMAPMAHMSTPGPYSRAPYSSSGALYLRSHMSRYPTHCTVLWAKLNKVASWQHVEPRQVHATQCMLRHLDSQAPAYPTAHVQDDLKSNCRHQQRSYSSSCKRTNGWPQCACTWASPRRHVAVQAQSLQA